MIFDYILKNRFYAPDNADAVDPSLPDGITNLVVEETLPNPYADIIPKAPNNRLETFLNMIVGDKLRVPSADYVAADPIKPISEMEYWLNEIAAAKGGNPWKDAAGKFVAKKISFQLGAVADSSEPITVYSLIIDTGLKEFPYADFKINGEANGCEIYTQNVVDALNITPLSGEVKNGDVFETGIALNKASIHLNADKAEVFPGDPGLLFGRVISIVFIKNGDDTIKMQVLMAFAYNDSDQISYNNEADELTFDTFDLKFVEAQNGGPLS